VNINRQFGGNPCYLSVKIDGAVGLVD